MKWAILSGLVAVLFELLCKTVLSGKAYWKAFLFLAPLSLVNAYFLVRLFTSEYRWFGALALFSAFTWTWRLVVLCFLRSIRLSDLLIALLSILQIVIAQTGKKN